MVALISWVSWVALMALCFAFLDKQGSVNGTVELQR